MPRSFPRTWPLAERILPWLVFAILAALTYSKFFLIPYAGFEFGNGQISGIYADVSGGQALRVGDRIVQVGGVTWAEFEQDLTFPLFGGAASGEKIRLVVDRDHQAIPVDWIYPGPTRTQILERLNSQWWLAYVFWFAGTATLLFIRPKNTNWFLLVCLNYLTALWLLASSGPSHWHISASAIVLRSAVWLSVPVYLHFHWNFPSPLARFPVLVWVGLYSAAVLLAALEWFQILPPTAYYLGFLIAFLGSVLFLISHFILQPLFRREVGILVLGAVLVAIPPLGIGLAFLLGLTPSPFVQGGAILALPALPGAYFFAILRRQFSGQEKRAQRVLLFYLLIVLLGTLFVLLYILLNSRLHLEQSTLAFGVASTILAGLIATSSFYPFLALPALTETARSSSPNLSLLEFRANRLVSYHLFVILVSVSVTLAFLVLDSLLAFPGSTVFAGSLAVVSAVVLTLVGFTPFQRLVERRLLDIPLPPEQLLETYSARITTSLDTHTLARLLRDEVLPSMLVRQSVALFLEENELHLLFAIGLEASQLTVKTDPSTILEKAINQDASGPYSWVRLTFPLKVNGELVGVWLLGKRDPDDDYTPADLSVLRLVANQTAIALANIAYARRLHDLYQADIERQEVERMRLARGLHDEVLSSLAAIAMKSADSNRMPSFQEDMQQVTAYLRQVIEDLRPAMLAYGLNPTLDELVDGLSERARDVAIQVDLPESEARYEPQVEQHLFRIVQQACENALRHAKASSIRIYGSLEPGKGWLAVEDNGVGFAAGDQLDLTKLLVQKHYGLVGMYERAFLIGAKLEVKSAPGEGTVVRIEWEDGQKHNAIS